MILDVVTNAIPVSGVVIIFPKIVNKGLEVIELGGGESSECVFLFNILECVTFLLTLSYEGVESDEGSSFELESAWIG